MAAKTYRTRALVLRKTKLGEKDLILTLLAEDGSLIRAVAKGARKPGGSHAAKAELFTPLAALLAEGRSLDVLCEAKREGPPPAPLSLEQSSCCAAVAELITLVAQEGLAQRRLFDLARASFAALADHDGETALLLCAAALWKITAQAGFRPVLDACALCGDPLEEGEDPARPARFSVQEGGAVCARCCGSAETIAVDRPVLSWCAYAVGARYGDIATQPDPSAAPAMIALAQSWTSTHMGRRLKSIDFLFTPGLFPS